MPRETRSAALVLGADQKRDYAAARSHWSADEPDRRFWAYGGLLTLLSVILFLVNTRLGVGILPDSTKYLGVGDWHYDAPVYAWLVRLPAFFGVDLATGAKALALIFVAANIFLVWCLLLGATGKYLYAIAGTALVAIAPQVVALHSTAMSEAPFLLFLLLSLLAILHYLDSEWRAWLVISAVLAGIATLTRFGGSAFAVAIALSLLLIPRHNFARRFADAAIYGIVSGGIFFVWVGLSQVLNGRSIGRPLSLYGNMQAEQWLTSLGALAAWLLPDDIIYSARVVVFVFVALISSLLIIAQTRQAFRSARTAFTAQDFLPLTLGLFIACYMTFMVVSTSIEANLHLNSRYALPAYVAAVMAVTIALARYQGTRAVATTARITLAIVAVGVLCSHAGRTTVRSLNAYHNGIGYAGTEWTQSPTLFAVRELPADAAIYSDGPDAIAIVLRRKAFFLPQRIKLRTGVEDPTNPLASQLTRLKKAPETQRTYAVFLDKVTWRFYQVPEDTLKRILPLVLVATLPDGRIYEVLPDGDGAEQSSQSRGRP